MPWKYAPIPNPNERTKADGNAYKEAREMSGDRLEDKAALFGITPEEYALFEAGEGLIIQDHQEVVQDEDGSVLYRNIEK